MEDSNEVSIVSDAKVKDAIIRIFYLSKRFPKKLFWELRHRACVSLDLNVDEFNTFRKSIKSTDDLKDDEHLEKVLR